MILCNIQYDVSHYIIYAKYGIIRNKILLLLLSYYYFGIITINILLLIISYLSVPADRGRELGHDLCYLGLVPTIYITA